MSTAAPFSLDPTLRTLSTAALLKRYKRLSPAERQVLGFTRPATDAEMSSATQAPGAPADFSGAVFPNPDGVQVSSDTDSGIPATRLPNGVTFQHGNWHGATPGDVSTPPRAELAAPAMQTVGATNSPTPLFDMSKAKPVGQPLFDMSKAKPVNAAPKEAPEDYLTHTEDRIDEVAKTASREVGSAWNTITGIPSAIYHAAADAPTDEEIDRHGLDEVTGPKRIGLFVERLTGAGQAAVAAKYYKRYLDAPSEEKRRMEEEMLSVAPEAIGAGAGAALTPKIIEKAPAAVRSAVGAGSDAASAIADTAKTVAGKVKNVTPKQAAQAAGGTTGAISGHGTLSAPGAYYGAKTAGRFVESVIGKERANQPIFPKKTAAPVEAPPVEDLEGVTSPQTEQAGALPAEAEPTPAAAAPTEPPVKTTTPSGAGIPRTLSGESALRQVLTGQDNANLIKIAKSRGINITQESQLKPGVADSKLINKIIDDFSDDELDGMRSQYLENTRMGKHNFGDIGPEAWKTMGMKSYFPDVKIPEAALRRTQAAIESAGQEKTVGETSTLQQKASNLEDFIRKPTAAKAESAAPKTTAEAKPAAAAPDLAEQLQKSLDLAKQKGGVFTSADPQQLTKRWGVNAESITDTDANVRGKTAAESKTYLDDLVKAYKSNGGKDIEPVIELRDADNNILEVDGRHRALAAAKAGVERIPVIIRRLQSTN